MLDIFCPNDNLTPNEIINHIIFIIMTKEQFFCLLDAQKLSAEVISLLPTWVKEYSVTHTNTLPCPVEYIGHDPDGEQNGMPSVYTTHLSKLSEGKPILAHLGVKILFEPVVVTPEIKTVGDLKKAAHKVYPTAHPMTQTDWNKFAVNQKTYFDLNKVLKGLKNPVDLPDIRKCIYFLNSNDDDCRVACRIDIATGDVNIVSIDDIDYILCIAN